MDKLKNDKWGEVEDTLPDSSRLLIQPTAFKLKVEVPCLNYPYTPLKLKLKMQKNNSRNEDVSPCLGIVRRPQVKERKTHFSD